MNGSAGLWDRLLGEFVRCGDTGDAANAFFGEGVDRVGHVRDALLKVGGNHRAVAVALLQKMSSEEQRQLFPELIQLARGAHGPVGAVRRILLSLPRPWVLGRIDAEVEKVLRDEQYDDYWMLWELLDELDQRRATKLARRAAGSADPDIRELGKEKLAGKDDGAPHQS